MGIGIKLSVIFLFLLAAFSGTAVAGDDVATVVAVRGKAAIERDKKEIEARVRDGIFLSDVVLTKEASRIKLLFIDDSVLSLSENSKVAIKEFVYSKEKGGKSIFNLIDGKMRSVVGKTEFEVHTPTAVAAARGTIILFETGLRFGRLFTTIICLEGIVNIMSIDPSIRGMITITPGMMATIVEKEPLPSLPSAAPKTEIERLKKDTNTSHHEGFMHGPAFMSTGAAMLGVDIPHAPQINQQPVNKTPVNIHLVFPR